MLKFIGGFFIIVATTSIGYVYAKVFDERVKQLRELQFILNILESEIIYSATPLAEAMALASNKSSTAAGRLFIRMSELLSERKVEGILEAYGVILKELKNNLYLEKEESDTIGSFVNSLGSADIEGQKKNFNITMKKLESFEKKAEENRDKNTKVFKYLGLCAGVLIVMILV